MKKLLAILACLLILCSFAACAAGSKAAPGNELYADQAAAEDGISYGSIKGDGMSEEVSQVTSADGAIEEKIVKTVNLTVETKEYEQYISAIRSDVAAAGGYVETSSLNDSYSGRNSRYASFVFRIPADKLDEFLQKAGENGKITFQKEDQLNVTLEYVDIQSRIKAYTTERDTLLELLKKADDLKDVISVQERLSDVNYQIENYTSQLRVLENRVSYSTVSLDLYEVERVTVTMSVYAALCTEDETSLSGEIKNALAENWSNLKQGIRDFIVWFVGGLPIIIPVAVLIAVAIIVLCKVIKKRKARKNIG